MASTDRMTESAPDRASAVARLAMFSVVDALSALCLTVEAISSMVDETSSALEACSVDPWERSWLVPLMADAPFSTSREEAAIDLTIPLMLPMRVSMARIVSPISSFLHDALRKLSASAGSIVRYPLERRRAERARRLIGRTMLETMTRIMVMRMASMITEMTISMVTIERTVSVTCRAGNARAIVHPISATGV